MDAATGNEHHPTVDQQKDGMSDSCVDSGQSWRLPGESATRTS